MKQTNKKIPMPVRYLINALLFVAFLIVGLSLIQSGVITKYYTKVLMLIGINIILTVSLNIATGYLGQLPLGHAGFMAVGAYTAAIFMTRSGLDASVSFPIGLVLGLPIGGAAGYWMGRSLGLPPKTSLLCALAAGPQRFSALARASERPTPEVSRLV